MSSSTTRAPADMPADKAKFWRESSFDGLDLLRARFVRHRFVSHAHDELVVAVFEAGAERFTACGATYVAHAGSILSIQPDVTHTGEAAMAEGWTYRCFYPSKAMLDRLRDDLFLGRSAACSRPVQQITDAHLHRQLIEAHGAFERRAPLAERQGRFIAACGRLLRALSADILTLRPLGCEHRAVRQAKEYIEAHFAQDIDASVLAAITGLSLSHFMRTFHREVGIPVHVYLTQVRLRHARALLVAGDPAAEVASAVGFADQSHLIRRFKEAYGATPGTYTRESMILQ